ncbi:MAG: hypothetical protein MZW92_12480 [Comamonadaceae bacterium]|nr:hypothetical protein [Comamonadaceae bacterium]
MGVSIVDLGNGAFSVSDAVDADQSLTSYIMYEDAVETTYETFLQYTGSEPGFSLDPTVRVQTLLGAYITQFVDAEYGLTAPTFTTFQSVMTYYENTVRVSEGYLNMTLTTLQNMANPSITVDRYVTGSVSLANNKDLDDHRRELLHQRQPHARNVRRHHDFGRQRPHRRRHADNQEQRQDHRRDGDRQRRSDDQLEQQQYDRVHPLDAVRERHLLQATAIPSSATSRTGRPSCSAASTATSTATTANTATGILYAVCTNYYGNNAGVVLSGGVYAVTTKQLSASGIAANADLDAGDDLFAMGVADTLGVSNGAVPGYRFTFPRSADPTVNSSSRRSIDGFFFAENAAETGLNHVRLVL